jgi:hypothetical protein
MQSRIYIVFYLAFQICFAQMDIPLDQIIHIKAHENKIERFSTLILDIELNLEYQNPFNPDEIKVDALINAPSQQQLVLPAFYHSDSLWQLRFTPDEIGAYQYQIRADCSGDTSTTQSHYFNVSSSRHDGFIRLNPQSNYTFLFDSRKLFRGIGENVAWTDDYEYYFEKLKETGCNFTRIWMSPWSLCLEWDEYGLGRYNLENAQRLDEVMELAQKYGIYIMLCFEYHGVAQKNEGYFKENKWNENPYNAQNGGPCKSAAEIFSNPEAKQYFKNRLRYIVARYGWSTHIHSWEFWNEVDLTAGRAEDVIAWHAEMAAYLKKIDPYRHLITSSFSSSKYPQLWDVEHLDFSQLHIYNAPDMVYTINKSVLENQKAHKKPHVIGEYGVDFRSPQETRSNFFRRLPSYP